MTDASPIHNAAALTCHIETRRHSYQRQQMSELMALTKMVMGLHGPDRDAPKELTAILAG